ncbi:uncharacterized protein At4g00950 isoform X2 [Malania oleifera]|nr:uncharacterized protein At4g00950 isoform X2 [Malania oleifera]
MACEEEAEATAAAASGADPSSTPKLPLFSFLPPPMQSPEPSGTLTPPLHATASVPFRWEEQPGKPRPCSALSAARTTCLHLPPRLFSEFRVPKMPSPTTVLDGPYVAKSLSFGHTPQAGYPLSICGSRSSPETGQRLGTIVLGKGYASSGPRKGSGLFGSWGWGRRRALSLKGKRDIDGGEIGGSNNTAVKVARIGKKGSFLNLPHAESHFWAT